MMVKVGRILLFVSILFFLFTLCILSDNSIDVEIYGGISNIKMGDYNSYIDASNDNNKSLGITSLIKKIEAGLLPEMNICYYINMPLFTLGLYLKNQFLLIWDASSVVQWGSGKPAQIIEVDFNVLYTGVGARINISNNDFPYLTGFAGIDGGVCYYFWNKMYEEVNQETGENIYKIIKQWSTIIPGMNIETGIQWMLSETIGFGLKVGYRLAKGNVTVKIININGWAGLSESEDNVDYSGFYSGAGLIIKFNPDLRKSGDEKIDKNSNFPGLSLWLYKEAKSFYEEGLYKQAKEKIVEAEKIAGENDMILKLKKQIEKELNIENVEEKIVKLLKQADEYRYKKQFKDARKIYQKVISLDEKNKQAQFYLEEFSLKAKEEFKKANEMMKQEKLKDALENINLAIEYGIGKEGEDLKTEIEESINKKKQKDKLYNDGVEHYRKGEYEDAINKWQQVLKIDPLDKEAQENIEKAFLKIKETNEEENSEVRKNLIDAKKFYNIGDFNTALEKCEYVLRLSPDNIECQKIVEEIKKIQEQNKVEIIRKR
ncbi:MAG: hypothetical protein N3E50_05370 [Candidatus Goldbacteria bacterium]|nr:hypothetical protein [Candidatus Goldiibacteriota bacterium]